MKEYEYVQVNHHKKIAKKIQEYLMNGCRLKGQHPCRPRTCDTLIEVRASIPTNHPDEWPQFETSNKRRLAPRVGLEPTLAVNSRYKKVR